MRTVSGVRAVPGLEGGTIELSWRNPPAEEFTGPANFVRVRVVRRERTYPRDASDGSVVYDGPVIAGLRDGGLEPQVPYYYTVYAVDDAATPNLYADDGSQGAGASVADRAIAERLYRLLPGVHQQRDRLSPSELAALPPAVLAALAALPTRLRGEGPLRRFFHATMPALDLARSTAERLPDLRDADLVPPRYLGAAAAWLDWPLDQSLELHRRRNEVKAAPFIHRATGTAPQVRALVTRYTGWETRIAELHQHVARASLPAQLNIFAITRDTTGWRGADDAAPALGFPPGNDRAVGGGTTPAVLVGAVPPAYPLPLRDGMEVTIAADGRPPVTVRLARGDFRSIGAATAREVAAVLNATLSEATARPFPASPLDPPPPTENRIEIRSHLGDASSAIAIVRSDASLVSLEGSPRGRLGACPDTSVPGLPRLRLAYETSEPMGPAIAYLADRTLKGIGHPHGPVPAAPATHGPGAGTDGSAPSSLPVEALGRARYKTLRAGTWGSSLAFPGSPGVPQGDPVIVELSVPTTDGSLFAAWVERPHDPASLIRYAIGRARAPGTARLEGRRSGPFVIAPGSHLALEGPWPDAVGVEFTPADVAAFANPGAATAAEVAGVIAARLPGGVAAGVNPSDQTLTLETAAAGGHQRLAVDLERSTAAAALGFEDGNATAEGDWGDAIDWGSVRSVPSVPAGRVADLTAVADPARGVVLGWCRHAGDSWIVEASAWSAGAWMAGPPVPVAPQVTGDGSRTHREPCLARDAVGRLWAVWARQEPAGSSGDRMLDSWTLRARVLPAGAVLGAWGAEIVVTSVPAGPPGRVADRQPGLQVEPGLPETLRVYFQSDRAGGPDLWELGIDTATQVPGGPTQVTDGGQADGWPSPVLTPDSVRWLLFRSDRSVPFARVGVHGLPVADHRVIRRPGEPRWTPRTRSVRAQDTGTVHRFAGTTTPVLRDAARIAGSRGWDDLLAYTPDKPLGEFLPPGDDRYRDQRLLHTDLFTRGTIQLFISEVIPASSVAVNMVDRLRAALTRYLPINVRLVVDLAPRPFEEFVYTPAADLLESYQDEFPFLDILDGLDDSVSAALPDWSLLLSTLAGHVSADPANPTTLRRRTFYPPPV
jgi:phage tail-like protein